MVSKTIDKTKLFAPEINYLKNEKYKEYLQNIIPLIPEYFYEVGVSSTGKYHPAFSNGKGGLLRHTKVAAKIAYELLNNNSLNEDFTEEEKDLIIIAIILHDSIKYGLPKEEYTRFDHPILASNFVKENKFNLSEREINEISDLIKTHMGEWTKDRFGREVLEKPTTKAQKFVHLCDYLSSKKFLNVEFENNDVLY